MMNNKPLEVGETGMVVYCSRDEHQHIVGSIVEIMAVDIHQEDPKEYYAGNVPGYPDSYNPLGWRAFYKDQIRRIQNPDKPLQKVRECVVS